MTNTPEPVHLVPMGYLAVDSAQLAIGDPCYWSDERLSYDRVIEAAGAMDVDEDICYTLGDLPHVGASMALAFPTIDGDGVYEVSSVWQGDFMIGYFVSVHREVAENE